MKLAAAVEAFNQQKRDSGFAYVTLALQLQAFARGIGDVDLSAVSPAHVQAFLDPSTSTYVWRRRHAQLAEFFRYWEAMSDMEPVGMPAQRAHVRRTFRPYVYSQTELRALFGSIERLPPHGSCTYDAETVRTLLLLLYGTGIRLSEAIALRPQDVDPRGRELHVWGRGKGQTLPLGKDIARVLGRYSRWKDRSGLAGETYLLREGGARLYRDTLYDIFHKLLALGEVSRRDRQPYRPRIYDIRSTFAVHQISGWMRKGRDLNRLLPALAHYMGLQDLAATEQFLTLTPERFRKELRKLSPTAGPL